MGWDSFEMIKIVVVGLRVNEFEWGSWILGFDCTVQNFVMCFIGKAFNKTNT